MTQLICPICGTITEIDISAPISEYNCPRCNANYFQMIMAASFKKIASMKKK